MRRGPAYTVLFAALVGIACAAALTVVGQVTKEHREINRRADRQKHVLAVLGVEPPGDVPLEDISNEEILELFKRTVEPETVGGLEGFKLTRNGVTEAVAFGFRGQGLWGTIYGYIALEPDIETIRGVTFYEHEETPGIGARIEEFEFRKQFAGREVVGPRGEVEMEVDAISGATMTSNRVETMLNRKLKEIRTKWASHER